MASTSEIVEVRDESNLLHHFGRANRLQIKLKATDGKSHDRLIDAIDLRTSPRILGPSRERASKKSVNVGLSGASGIGISESPSLKQALRRLCISQASETAAIRRSQKLIASSKVSDVGTIGQLHASVVAETSKPGVAVDKEKANKNSLEKATQVGEACNMKSPRTSVSALKNAKMRRAQDLISTKHRTTGTGNSKASKHAGVSENQYNACSIKKEKHESVPAPGNSSKFNKFSDVGIKNSSSGAKVNGGHVLREKGGCSQSSQSSLADHSSSTSTSISEDSNYYGSSSNCNRPHMSKDARWVAIHQVVKEQGSLGLKNFKLLRRLGCGDIGTVYLAELLGSKCLFALKVMDIELLVSRKKMLRAQTERHILRILDHPFLPTLYAHITTDNLSILVMEYCPGGDLHVLRQMQPGRSFHEPAARFYVAEVLLALEYLHMLGVIYRDLKPENILVREDGHIMLSDFDLSMRCTVIPTLLSSSSLCTKEPQKKISKSCTEASYLKPFCLQPSLVQVSCFTPCLLSCSSDIAHVSPLPQLVVEPADARSNSFVGTHEYLAPEIIRGDGHGSSVDWWTLGIFLYELLFGRTPFKGTGNEDTLANVVSRSLKFPESQDVSFYAKDLIRGLLIKEPESRLGSVRGAAEIKQHPFFEGLNWALIRCAAPLVSKKEEEKYLDFNQLF